MGRIRIVVQSEELSTTTLHTALKKALCEVEVPEEVTLLVVPDEEEYPDLS